MCECAFTGNIKVCLLFCRYIAVNSSDHTWSRT